MKVLLLSMVVMLMSVSACSLLQTVDTEVESKNGVYTTRTTLNDPFGDNIVVQYECRKLTEVNLNGNGIVDRTYSECTPKK